MAIDADRKRWSVEDRDTNPAAFHRLAGAPPVIPESVHTGAPPGGWMAVTP